jgi:Sulfite exporter TauE/SafE
MLAVAIPAGLLIGLSLGALGGGGSILTVPALVYLLHQQPRTATTGSLLIVGITALAGMIAHRRAGRVRVAQGVTFGVLGVAGSYAGTWLSASVHRGGAGRDRRREPRRLPGGRVPAHRRLHRPAGRAPLPKGQQDYQGASPSYQRPSRAPRDRAAWAPSDSAMRSAAGTSRSLARAWRVAATAAAPTP